MVGVVGVVFGFVVEDVERRVAVIFVVLVVVFAVVMALVLMA